MDIKKLVESLSPNERNQFQNLTYTIGLTSYADATFQEQAGIEITNVSYNWIQGKNYDEQHPKRGRTQKFRLTLLNYETKIPIAEPAAENRPILFTRRPMPVTPFLVMLVNVLPNFENILRAFLAKRPMTRSIFLMGRDIISMALKTVSIT